MNLNINYTDSHHQGVDLLQTEHDCWSDFKWIQINLQQLSGSSIKGLKAATGLSKDEVIFCNKFK